ncbi:uncharacterized protein LAESUDRAFT_730922 [Laetiporus sulphureus 93-53]|uniref:Galactose oxidase n=1 Tax=Laetiporus sulphureus 93-53 TaxID=1314785 RepID=A0A165BVZ1_9APHY|nr:uncharacterized protein LAESUDRAFT_730922 [Laetiporus sulphureus 93-53]KZT01751.1 hypothetical protein LAESUDRAFT_730922 [Laetiporus sulphureus 93-53]
MQSAYLWSQQRLTLTPPLTIPTLGVAPPNTPSPSPFARYGELYQFGGLVHDTVRNELYLLSTRDLSATLLQTAGEIPSPRVGHASALIGYVLIVWGGNTKNSGASSGDEQDERLYLLNLGMCHAAYLPKTALTKTLITVSQEWTRVAVYGPAPSTASNLNDLWAFDLNTQLVEPAEGSPRPAQQTGHICVTYENKIVLFGGTDCEYHYNDTWMFDTMMSRGLDGKDLGDLGAFKISNQRWYMFQKIGSAPSPRSGHAMASVGSRVFVLGGLGGEPVDPNIIPVLETENIKYPSRS